MAISAKTLFHFTKERDTLLKILDGSLLPNYSLEDLSSILSGGPIYDVYVPMVCFCDIVLSQIKDHIAFYGSYGIGLRKSWGLMKGVTPVVYVDHGSRTAQLMRGVVAKADSDKQELAPILRQRLLDFCKYVKPYEGEVLPTKLKPKKGKTKKVPRIFYDEREWRYSPDDYHAFVASVGDEEKVAIENAQMRSKHALRFDPGDVKYIIVSEESEIPYVIDAINANDRFSGRQRSILASKVISAEQIREDM